MNGSESRQGRTERLDPDAHRPAVLVVDDEESILFALEDFLTATGWRVVSAGSAEHAVSLLGSGPFAAAVVDLRLADEQGDESGLGVVRRLRERWPATRVILLTAYGSGIERDAAALGISAVLAKPQPLAQLEAQLRDLIADAN